MTTAIDNEIAAITRAEIERHDEWDSLHHLLVLVRYGGSVKIDTYAAIDPAYDPGEYPLIINTITREVVKSGKWPYALVLQIEAFGAMLPPDATPEEQADFELDGRNRTIHKRPDAVEAAYAITVDVSGRMWTAMKTRGNESEITEATYGPDDHHALFGGRLTDALLAALRLYGTSK